MEEEDHVAVLDDVILGLLRGNPSTLDRVGLVSGNDSQGARGMGYQRVTTLYSTS